MLTPSHSRILAVLLAAVVLIGAANLAAYAANGKPLLLGKSNSASKKTTVTNNGSGPALRLRTKPGQPPLQVNRSDKVRKLNADLVDGEDAADLKTRGYRYELATTAPGASHQISFPGLPSGRYLMTYNIISRNGGNVYCLTDGSRQALSYSSDVGAAYDVNTASAIIDTTEGDETLTCTGAAALELYSTASDAVSEVAFVSLDSAKAGTPVATRAKAPRGGGAASSN